MQILGVGERGRFGGRCFRGRFVVGMGCFEEKEEPEVTEKMTEPNPLHGNCLVRRART